MERDERWLAQEFAGTWWLFLIVGILWLLVALVIRHIPSVIFRRMKF